MAREEVLKYRAQPVEVDAFKIIDVGPIKSNGQVFTHCEIALENGQNVKADMGKLARMVPVPGDYWVIQSDGYVYLNPKDVFERKYSPVEEG